MKVVIILSLVAAAFAAAPPANQDSNKVPEGSGEPDGNQLTFKEINSIAEQLENTIKGFIEEIEKLEPFEGDMKDMKPRDLNKYRKALKLTRLVFRKFMADSKRDSKTLEEAEDRAEKSGFELRGPCGEAFAKIQNEMPVSAAEVDLDMFRTAVKLHMKCIWDIATDLNKPITRLVELNAENADETVIAGCMEEIRFLFGHIFMSSSMLHDALETAKATVDETKNTAP